ncbi:MAG TPA: carboxypeptidase regulatory-like domain-containing protein [Bryobacteraceae bacterium]|nr:carboxypeptidase regulatory-like domain-containing protein [Bryobacteraceae bacterium]
MRFLAAYALLALSTGAMAQTVSSTVKGAVQDSSGAFVAGAVCKLINPSTNQTVTVASGSDGAFQFLDVLAGTYTVSVAAPGFKTYELTNIEVLASEFHSVGNVVLQVGQATDSIIVADTVAELQIASGERSDTITGSQLNDIAVKGRDFVSYLATLTGVVDTNTSRDSIQRNALSGIHINGGRDTQTLLVVDGMPLIDAGNNGPPQEPNMDAISEVRVLAANYQAEYGRNGGGTVTVISKTGTKRFHGSAYDYYRHEDLNANNFFNNATLTPIAPYRYRMTGWSLGGPVIVPKKRDLVKDKLFFFFSQELVGSLVTNAAKFQTTPSLLEREGNYSQSYNTNGSLISIKDPLNNKAAFPGNIIPASRFDAIGEGILNFYPLPNYTDPSPAKRYSYNLRSTYSGGWPRRQNMGRLDFSLTPTVQVYYRVLDDYSDLLSPWGNWVNGSANYLITPISWDRPARSHTVHLTKIFTATLVDELTIGKAFNGVYISPQDPSKVDRSLMGTPPALYTSPVGQANWLPSVAFGGTPANTINSSLADVLPEGLPDTAYMLTNNLSKVWRTHQFKAGIYMERNHKLQPASVSYRGSYNFKVDGNNPYNTGDGFANAQIGYFDTYTQANNWPVGSYLFRTTEWYVQDNWRVTRRLTLDYGMRFYHIPATQDLHHAVATFDPGYYIPSQAPVLYKTGTSGGTAVAINPITGATAPAVYVGQFVPGVGNPADGAQVAGVNGYPSSLYTTQRIAYGPRFGFAYDVFGNGKTVVRGGFGMFKDRVQGNVIYNAAGNPPVTTSPTIYYSNFATISQGAAQGLINGVAGPTAITEVYGRQPLPSIMNFNFGVQRQLGRMVVDVAYVGALNRHLPLDQNLNAIPIYSRFANPGVTDNFLRPYPGFANITDTEFVGTSNYNSVQASLRRRLSAGLQLGASYTFAKALGTASTDGDTISSYFAPRFWNYGPLSFNRTQTFNINYLYDLPRMGSRLHWRGAAWVLDDWEISGITMFQTGAPYTPGFSTTNGEDISGSTDGARIEVIGNPYNKIPAGLYFNPAAFALPAVHTFGNAGPNILYGPGANNWDLSMTKRFRFRESRVLSIRGEAFNAWNHTQFSGVYSTANFQPTGAQIDPTLGMPSSARPARNVQLSARFMF